ncbi:MAG TPA: PilZ domain-containing protein [Candidatus Acidoferrum sp.]|nr:PilZ domain-containing protein [Candidatus Acidoferrum sp.]
MTTLSELEFLLVSNDYATLTAVSGGVKKYEAKLALVPNAEAAKELLGRRKIDAVFVDLEVDGALLLIEAVRKGASSARAAIFACVKTPADTTQALSAGANFALRAPLTIEGVALHITIAKEILLRERRRYFRHPVNLTVMLKEGSEEQQARMTNLSEGGMALRSLRPLKHGTTVEFWFEFTFGEEVSGRGQVAWTSTEGMAGILFQTIHGMGRGYLGMWLTAQEQLKGTVEKGGEKG